MHCNMTKGDSAAGEQLRRLPHGALASVWWPFTQHQGMSADRTLTIDARAGETLVTGAESLEWLAGCVSISAASSHVCSIRRHCQLILDCLCIQFSLLKSSAAAAAAAAAAASRLRFWAACSCAWRRWRPATEAPARRMLQLVDAGGHCTLHCVLVAQQSCIYGLPSRVSSTCPGGSSRHQLSVLSQAEQAAEVAPCPQGATNIRTFPATSSSHSAAVQGVGAELQPRLVAAMATAAARYGHVMHPETASQPAVELAQRLLSSAGRGWARRVFYSDDGCGSDLNSHFSALQCRSTY